MRTEHAVTGLLHAPRDQVGTALSNFADQSWNPGITECHLVDDDVIGLGAIRAMTTPDGLIIYERLDALHPNRRLSYAFAWAPPVPVLTSHVTVTLTDTADGATRIVWAGAFDVLSDDDARAAEHAETELAWPALITGLASKLGVQVDLHPAS